MADKSAIVSDTGTGKTELELWKEYVKTKSPEIKEELIKKYAYLIKIVAGRMNIYTNSIIDYEDLVGYGVFGLIDAIDKFDYKKGYKFQTYASLRIRGEIIDNIRKIDWIPRTVRQKNKELENIVIDFKLEHGYEPSIEEIAKELKISVDKVEDYIKSASLYNLISLDGYLENKHERINTNLIEKNGEPYKNLEKQEDKQILIDTIDSLTDRQKMVITLYYYEELTLKEISKILEVSESRVSQIHSECIRILKNKLGKNFVQSYL